MILTMDNNLLFVGEKEKSGHDTARFHLQILSFTKHSRF